MRLSSLWYPVIRQAALRAGTARKLSPFSVFIDLSSSVARLNDPVFYLDICPTVFKAKCNFLIPLCALPDRVSDAATTRFVGVTRLAKNKNLKTIVWRKKVVSHLLIVFFSVQGMFDFPGGVIRTICCCVAA